jgi:two-component system, response regulator
MVETDKRRPSVLIAEDDPDDRLLLEEIFRGFGDLLEIHFVEDGERLMETLHRGATGPEPSASYPGLILMDLNMPRKDGREALLEIKKDPSFRKIPVVVLTTSALEEDKLLCGKAGADGYVTKPGGFNELDHSIREVVMTWLHVSIPPQERMV